MRYELVTKAAIPVKCSHTGRFRSEAAFAAFSGAAPIPASSGLTTRHCLSRSGDRQLSRALHTITLIRPRINPDTRTYLARRTAKITREARRYLKRIIARQILRHLSRAARHHIDPLPCPRRQ